MTHADVPTTSSFIQETAQRLRALSRRSQQAAWHMAHHGETIDVVQASDWQQWPLAPVNERGHIAWPRGKQPLWLCQQITVPAALAELPLVGLALRLGLTWWAEQVAVYIDGQLVQAGDLFDYFARIKLSDRITPGDTFQLAIFMVSPGHDDGALVRSEVIYESPDPAHPEPAFVADELTVLETYAAALAPEKLTLIARAIAPLDWSRVADQGQFQAELLALRERLLPLSPWIKRRCITCTGHAHLDLAWLWPVADTWQAAERTFKSVLGLQTDFPELTYTHSSPALFAWLEVNQPELFQAVQAAVRQGQWSIDAGLWVEPELNTIGGESLARQILYGQRYTRSRFGQVSAIAWLPDSFGFSWQLPQLLRLGGVDFFATQKLRWNETTQFPHSLFWWQGPDGTAILSLTLPPIGTDVDPVQMATHSAEWETKTGLTEMLWLPGMGDHGGGPTRDMLETARRWQVSPFFPQLSFGTPTQHLTQIAAAIATKTKADGDALPVSNLDRDRTATFASPIPVWHDELYLELHRGCYTVHADQKWYNRRCEDTLREAEIFATFAHWHTGTAYPKADLETAWKQILFNQFHDILPGTAIPEVFATANPEWQQAYDTAKAIRQGALSTIAQHLPLSSRPQTDAVPIFVFNSLNWEHTDLVAIAPPVWIPALQICRIFDPAKGQWLAPQISPYRDRTETPPGHLPVPQNDDPEPQILFLATVPALGYRLYWLVPSDATDAEAGGTDETAIAEGRAAEYVLENSYLRAVIDAQTGAIAELWEQTSGQNLLRSPGNYLQAFKDSGQYWDAWDIAPNYETQPLPGSQLKSIQWLEQGPLRWRLRVVRTIADSTVQQDYVLDQHLPYLQVTTVVDWQATQVVLKTAFPLSVEADQVTSEIPFGAIARFTHSEDPHAQAKWEVPAYRWADLSDDRAGLSILTDYKHGFDAKPNQLRLTLLKAPLWPNPKADRGRHHFTYALYPHADSWQQAQTPHRAIAFNTPLHAVIAPAKPLPTSPKATATDATAGSFLPIDATAVHLAALKPTEDAADQYVLRFWEMYGQSTALDWRNIPFERTNLLEDAIAVAEPSCLTPWQIATFKISAFPTSL